MVPGSEGNCLEVKTGRDPTQDQHPWGSVSLLWRAMSAPAILGSARADPPLDLSALGRVENVMIGAADMRPEDSERDQARQEAACPGRAQEDTQDRGDAGGVL